jgi:fructokinase
VKSVLSFGETLWDLLPSGPLLGGASFNLAYRVNSLGERGVIVTRLGRDLHGRQAFDQAKGSPRKR